MGGLKKLNTRNEILFQKVGFAIVDSPDGSRINFRQKTKPFYWANLYFRFENIKFRCLEEKSNGREKKSTGMFGGSTNRIVLSPHITS